MFQLYIMGVLYTIMWIILFTNTDMTYKEVKYGLGNVSVGDYQPVYDSETVWKYVTKHIGKDVDYDIVNILPK